MILRLASIIFSNSLVGDGRERALIFNAPLLSFDLVDGLNLYAYAGSNPLKYIDPTGHVKVHPIDGGKPHELDVLSPIEGTYRSDNLFDFPES
jgi:hypothetical protein